MSYVPPTLEGRVLVDLGQQLTAMRARAEQAEADAFKFRSELVALQIDHDNLRHALTVEGQYRTQAEASNARLLAALEAVREQSYGDEGAIPDMVDAALAATPEPTITELRADLAAAMTEPNDPRPWQEQLAELTAPERPA